MRERGWGWGWGWGMCDVMRIKRVSDDNEVTFIEFMRGDSPRERIMKPIDSVEIFRRNG